MFYKMYIWPRPATSGRHESFIFIMFINPLNHKNLDNNTYFISCDPSYQIEVSHTSIRRPPSLLVLVLASSDRRPRLLTHSHVCEWAEPPSRPPQPVPLALISLHAARVLPAQLCFSEWGIQWGHLVEVFQSWKTRNSLILLFEELERGDSRVRDSSLMLSRSLSLELFGLVANISKYGLQDK